MMFKNEFFRFFAIGFTAGALIVGGTLAHASAPVASAAIHMASAR